MARKALDLFVVTGEPSGDLLASHLIAHLPSKLQIGGVLGPHLRKMGIEEWFPMEELQVMGFSQVVRHLPRLARAFFKIRSEILASEPKGVLFVDYPGLHLRLQSSLRKAGYTGKLIQYVSPTVWAWGKKRMFQMEKNLDLLMTLLPFEPACFASTSLPTRFVGHPFACQIKPRTRGKERHLIALFPGSRQKEIEHNLPLQLEAAKDHPIAISVASTRFEPLIRSIAPKAELVALEDRYELMEQARLAIATSGSVTLELALHETPTVVTYFISPIDLFLAQKIFGISLAYYALPNLIANQLVFPELFGPHFTPFRLKKEVDKLLSSPESVLAGCEEVRRQLGQKRADLEAARLIEEVLCNNSPIR